MKIRSTLPLLSAIALLSSACAATPMAEAQTLPVSEAAQLTELSQTERFEAWKIDFTNRAIAKGYDRALVTTLLKDAVINELALDRDRDQPEFTKPVWSYVDNAASTDRLNTGRARLTDTTAIFNAVESRYNVPRYILTAIWGLETSYGRIMGNHDTISALSTFAFEGRRTAFGEQQLFAVLDLVSAGDVRPEQLTGSWAGAMGMTQFIPTTFRDYAVDFDNDGNKDLWNNRADALGSAAHYLARHGWRRNEPVMAEVSVPQGFDYSLLEGTKKTINQWIAIGVAPITGERWTADDGFLEAKMIAPGGHRGPKILTFKNFDVIKRYNNSTSYAMGITVLGEALNGKAILQTPWPREDKPLSFDNKKAMQARLTQLGFSTGGIDGQVGPNTRKAIRAWQRSMGLPADGYMEQSLFQKLMGR
ncbi:membrane-bound lytic murein transglycosylase B [Litorimonas taeanensis]|uniref:Membrane-bound lytic murein transglycosylase B n=1 Tax=Litorimonas taeanensis TaxID=568099 RepID=A0A420WDT8_9PROT|nr:lytic murein transglycosylase [Litorimonas taeanensis]RKQ69163.1 membrane-bound lytic murein transglycosylase B [Litorimonas taeanensis]